ncbi:MAG: hypothetical protein K6G87_09560 [Butyrivibrio sp.]|uniref:hypothetical protein n=1 Tax=Butyrivibrio sp. TaxID=28121 RepID=UPI0025E5DEB8|nr:hypothetical protein [Butyrivibrio sp.]MCR5771462.1 hypothetical protein [Butyrivibrio sp.]
MSTIDIDGLFYPGEVIYNNFHISSTKTMEEQWDNLHEDLIQVEYEGGLILDIGWYPECDPTGRFIINLIKDYNWENPLKKIETKNICEMYSGINTIMDEFIRSKDK